MINSKIKQQLQDISLGLVDPIDFILKLDKLSIHALTKPKFSPNHEDSFLTNGKIISEGVAAGKVYNNIADLLRSDAKNKLLFIDRLTNDMVCHFDSIDGIITMFEDPTSHAAIVANGSGLPLLNLSTSINLTNGTEISLDCFQGSIYLGLLEIIEPPKNNRTATQLLELLSKYSKIQINGNADNAHEVAMGDVWGAKAYEPRTEHMILKEEAIKCFRLLLLSNDQKVRSQCLDSLEQFHKAAILDMYLASGGKKLIIRLFDPPAHEFLPHDEKDLTRLQLDLGITEEELSKQIKSRQEINPMMGHRGVRLLLTDTDILKMQVRAIFKASFEVSKMLDKIIVPHITIPMVIEAKEIKLIKNIIYSVHKDMELSSNYQIGVMIETPRAVLNSEAIGREVDYISFGTNDLTAQTFAFSRGDVLDKFLTFYLDNDLIPVNPFIELDETVAQQMSYSVDHLRKSNPNIWVGLCGEQGSQKKTIEFCNSLNMNSISVAANKIPISLLYAAQANLQGGI